MRPLILIVNDDGIYSPGLIAAAEAVAHLGDLLIAAPRFQQTGMGRSFPKSKDIGVIEQVKLTVNGKSIEAYGVHGSPAHAVSYAVLELASRKPDLCISGINYGENLGRSLSCSGTIGAALEADSYNIPSIAVSVQAPLSIQHSSNYEQRSWDKAKEITAKIVQRVLKNGMPEKAQLLNINVPNECTTEEVRITEQSRLNYSVFTKPLQRDKSISYILQSKPDPNIDLAEKNSDIYAIYFDRVISVTPLTWKCSVQTTWKENNR